MQDFQAFTVRFSGRTNVLFCDVGVSQAFNPKAITVSPPPIINVKSIWDTGATCTVISKEFAGKVGLIPTGKTRVTGVNHTSVANTYLVTYIYQTK